MEPSKDSKRKKDGTEDDAERHRERKSKRARSRSQSIERTREKDSRRKRRHSRSRSPDNTVKQENQNERSNEVKAEPPARKAKETDMLNTRTGGAYIPPARLRMMQAQITDKSSIAYQRLAWEALKKSIHGHINKINVGNIGIIIKELLKENIVRGRGLLCRSVIQAQAASPTFTNVYAALVAAVNSRFPNIGELLLKRLVIQFKRGFKRNDKSICISAASFIAHLVNQRVAHEILALELLTLLVETPSDDSVEVAIAFLKECGQKLTEVSSKGVNAIFDMLRNILHEGQLDKRVQYMIEVMFQVWKDGFKDHPALLEELELVPEEEQFTHLLMLDDATDPQDILNVFKHDEKYEENEQKYKTLSKEILGSDAESEEGSGESGTEESDDQEEEEDGEQKEMTIIDNTETNLVALRRTIYLTINSSLDFEECAHKLMKMQLKPGQEVELCHMFLDCCAEQRTYEKFYGLLAQRFCNLNRIYISPFEEIFKDSYGTAHRLDTNRLRNVSKFFAHLLFTDSISWEVLECVRLNEEDTTSSSRIYIKILFQELAEYMGLKKLNDRLKDPTLQGAFSGVFPRDNPKNTRFSINFFTSIGLGGLTDELREHLKQMPKNVPPPPEINLDGSSSDSSSSSSSSSSDSSSSDSEDDSSKKKKDKKKSKKDKKNKTPKTPEGEPDNSKNKEGERWGHEGFYDNYGKDARRHEPERDKDNFVIPKIPSRNDRRRGDDSRRRNDDRPDRDRNDGSRDESRDKRQRDDRRSDRDDGRRDREKDTREDSDGRTRDRVGDNERHARERNTREDSDGRACDQGDDERRDRGRNNNEDRERQARRQDDDRGDKERTTSDHRDKQVRREKNDRRDKERNTADEREREAGRDGSDKRDRERNTNYDRDEPARGRERDSGRREKERNMNYDNEWQARREDDRRDRERNNRDEERQDRDGSKRDGEDRHSKTQQTRRDNRSDSDGKRDRNRIGRDDESRHKDKRDYEGRNKESRDDVRRDREMNDGQRRERNDREERRDRYNERDDRDTRRREDNDVIHEKRGMNPEVNGKENRKQKKEKSKSKKDKEIKKVQESDSSDSDSSSNSSDDSSSSSSSSSSDEENSRRKKKDDDGWDIRGSSLKKEIVGRYWELPDRRRETVERSPDRSDRRKDR